MANFHVYKKKELFQRTKWLEEYSIPKSFHPMVIAHQWVQLLKPIGVHMKALSSPLLLPLCSTWPPQKKLGKKNCQLELT